MCLLISQPEGVSFSDEWIADFVRKNDDGFGYAYAENGHLYYHKMTGPVEKVIETYHQVAGRQAMLHFRMATAGEVAPENSHPYVVLGSDDGFPLMLAHNGVLSCGNSYDKSMSDTYHYVHTYLRPILLEKPELYKNAAFKKMVESHIGAGNKFILMDATGHIEIYNQSAGLEWEAVEGQPKAWMSNTYAWDAAKAGLVKSYATTTYGGGSYGWNDEDWGNGTYYPGRRKTRAQTAIPPYVPRQEWVINFASELFRAMLAAKLNKVWAAYSYSDIHDFAEKVGKATCDDLLADVKANILTEETFDAYISMSSALADQNKPTARTTTHEFFVLLKQKEYQKAWEGLRVVEVTEWMSKATDADYKDVITAIKEGTATDDGIIAAIINDFNGSI